MKLFTEIKKDLSTATQMLDRIMLVHIIKWEKWGSKYSSMLFLHLATLLLIFPSSFSFSCSFLKPLPSVFLPLPLFFDAVIVASNEYKRASLVAQWKRTCLSIQEMQVSIPGLGIRRGVRNETATHSSILAWEIHGQRSLTGYSPWDCIRVEHDLVTKQQTTTTMNTKIKSYTAY